MRTLPSLAHARYLYFAGLLALLQDPCHAAEARAQDAVTVTFPGALAGDKTRVTPAVEMAREGATIGSEDALLDFARSQIGVPYRYASADPRQGFDCSGFVTYVYGHFGIALPRSSKDFLPLGSEVFLHAARPGDLILFTGTDAGRHEVGHLGIVETNAGGVITFLHSSSGKARGVVRTTMQPYYLSRFIKVIRVLDGQRPIADSQ